MEFIKFPDDISVDRAISENEPLLMLISFDAKTAILSHIDEAVEHHILLSKAGFSDKDIYKYFRVVINSDGCDWTFICPPDYKGITHKDKRIGQFYKDGFSVISSALEELGLMVGINIPRRYRRHSNSVIE